MADSSTLAIAAPTGTESPVGEWWTESERRPAQAREQVIDDADVWLGEVDPEAYVVTPRLVAFGPGVQPRFRLLQSWEGRVVEVFDGGFVAHLCDLTTPGVEEQVEIEMEEISSDDAPLVVPGAVFYWGIGYLRSPSGSMTRASEIRFRRLPRWSKRDVGRIAERVAELKARTGIGG